MSSEASVSRVSTLDSFPLLCRSVSPFCLCVILTALSNLSFHDTNRWAARDHGVLFRFPHLFVEQGVNATRACPGWGMRAALLGCVLVFHTDKRGDQRALASRRQTANREEEGCCGLKRALEKRGCLAAGASWFWSEHYPEFSWQHP